MQYDLIVESKTKAKLINREQIGGCQRGSRRGLVKCVKMVKKYKLPVIK